ncbi:MAG: hypothetical protein HAW62_02220 [Endozoicomonadaceae bacterium]|nr:hypothetical protein [Endozoicomonadaceae bacterium]
MDLYYIGLMSGTSADGLDVALLVIHSNQKLTIQAAMYRPFSIKLTDKILELQNKKTFSFKELGDL